MFDIARGASEGHFESLFQALVLQLTDIDFLGTLMLFEDLARSLNSYWIYFCQRLLLNENSGEDAECFWVNWGTVISVDHPDLCLVSGKPG